MYLKIITVPAASILLSLGLLSAPLQAAVDTTPTQQTKATSIQSVSINSANAAVLAKYLIGVGPTKAEAIVAWRSKNGRFKEIEQLLEVKGIGSATLNKNKHLITL